MTHRSSILAPRRPRAPALALLVVATVGAGCTQVSVPERTEIDGAAVEVSPVAGAPEGLVLHEAKVPDGVASLTWSDTYEGTTHR